MADASAIESQLRGSPKVPASGKRPTVRRMRKALNNQPKIKAVRLAFLVKWAAVRKNNLLPPRAVRERFQRQPWRPRVKPCWCCFRVATLVRHHIIQIQHGGSNEGGNIVMICEWCHVEIHPWMSPPADHPVVKAVQALDELVQTLVHGVSSPAHDDTHESGTVTPRLEPDRPRGQSGDVGRGHLAD